MTVGRIRLGDMLRAGGRAVSQYTGTVLAVYLVQLVAAGIAGFAILSVLSNAFSDRMLFDQAVDGDLVSLLTILRDAPAVVGAVTWIALGAVVAWMVWSWYFTGGVLAVLTERPRGRLDTARCFGAGGASTFLVFARLGVVSVLLQFPALVALSMGLGYLAERIGDAVTVGELIGPLIVGLGPAALLHVLASTVVDYARAELTLRRPTHDTLGALRAAIRAVAYLARRPVALLHVGAYWLGFVLVWLLYLLLAKDRAMLGTSGALALFAIRQAVMLVRTALKVGFLAGQVELTATRPPPPRTIARVESRDA